MEANCCEYYMYMFIITRYVVVSGSEQCTRPSRCNATFISAHNLPSYNSQPKMATFVDVACQCDSDDPRSSDSPCTAHSSLTTTTKRFVGLFHSQLCLVQIAFIITSAEMHLFLFLKYECAASS